MMYEKLRGKESRWYDFIKVRRQRTVESSSSAVEHEDTSHFKRAVSRASDPIYNFLWEAIESVIFCKAS